jgi:hypothetical protein
MFRLVLAGRDWWLSSRTDLCSGYAPLTLHWSTPGGLWSSPLVTAMFGTIAASGQLITEWRKGATT